MAKWMINGVYFALVLFAPVSLCWRVFSNTRTSFRPSLNAHLAPIGHERTFLTHMARGKSDGEFYAKEIDMSNDDEYEDDDDDDNFKIIESGMAKSPKEKNDQEWMFFDVAKVNCKGGDGGDGCMAMRREYCIEFGGPSGGNGGKGGSVYLECDETINTLAMLRRRVHYRGKDGTNGRGDSRHGQRGDDVVIPVPPGTIVRDQFGVLAGELNNHKDRMLVARGGKGGRGNEHFKTPRMNAPSFAEKGEVGRERWLNVELKLIADVGLVGIPNAGKSTLLAAVSNAKPKIADYPFTTVVPNLGVCDLFVDKQQTGEITSSLVVADIPGLLEGAHEGVGLGLSFLRHVQRCRVLVHMIKGDSEDPIGDFTVINQELEMFNPRLANKTQVVVVNKIDIPEVREKLNETMAQLRKLAGHTRVMGISAATGENVKDLMKRVYKVVESLPRQTSYELFTEDEERVNFEEEDDDHFEVLKDEHFPGQYRVVGNKIENLVEMTNWNYYEATQRFQRVLEAQGISAALDAAGAKQGDLIMIGDWDFNYWDKKHRWIAELGLEDINPRRRPSEMEDD